MFEALRGLRDAVAPESGNLGSNSAGESGTAATTAEPDVDELWQAYCNGDESAVALVQKLEASDGGAGQQPIQTRAEFVQRHAVAEREKDADLVRTLAAAVLERSARIDVALEHVPGAHRTRSAQLAIVGELIAANAAAAVELDAAYRTAVARRDECRRLVRSQTSAALGIDEEED